MRQGWKNRFAGLPAARFRRMTAAGLALLGGCATAARAVQLELQAVAGSGTALEGHPESAAVDGLLEPGNGWSVQPSQTEVSVVFRFSRPCEAPLLLFDFAFLCPEPGTHFREIELNVTSDPEPGPGGRWMPLIPEVASAQPPVAMAAGAGVRLQRGEGPVRAVLLARIPFSGVTGFRLRIFPGSDAPGAVPALSHADNGIFRLTEVRVESADLPTSSMARGRQVYCSRAVAAGLPSRNLTDGFNGTWSRPEEDSSPAFFEMDLGRDTDLDHIVLRHPDPSGAPADISYAVEILPETGAVPGAPRWQGSVPGGGNRAVAVRESDGAGRFSGRRLRIHSTGAAGMCLSEIEVYPRPELQAADWMCDARLRHSDTTVSVAAGAEVLRFRIAPRAPLAAEALEFRWRIPGWTAGWQQALENGRAAIEPMPGPGDYRLEFQARHSDGIWAEGVTGLHLHLDAPWWRAPPGIAIVCGAALIGGMGLWWAVSHLGMRRRIARAQQRYALDQERIRIARDMHDDMGARLSSLALTAERARHLPPAAAGELLESVADGARSAVAALDGIVWSVDPGNDTSGHLADYLSDYAPGFLETAGIRCRMQISVSRPGAALALAARHALLMAAKEALTNAARHSGTETVLLGISDAGGILQITVADSGSGISGRAAASSRGLRNMEARMRECGGQCTVQTCAAGTTITLSVPCSGESPTQS